MPKAKVLKVVALPGAGKTTAMKLARGGVYGKGRLHRAGYGKHFTRHLLTHAEMSTDARRKGMGQQRIEVWASPDWSVVEIGRFTSDPKKPNPKRELVGTDWFSPPQCTRVKFVVDELCARKQVKVVLLEGILFVSGPYAKSVGKHNVTTVQITTPEATCKRRCRARNAKMVKEGRLKFVPDDAPMYRAASHKIALAREASKRVVERATPEKAAAFIRTFVAEHAE